MREYEILTRLSIVKDSAISFISLGKENYTDKETNSSSSIVKLDNIDLAILSLLNNNARIMNTKIASSLKISAESARMRIKKLEKLKVIRGYRAMLDVSKLGYMLFMILIETNMTFYQKEKHLFTLFGSMPNIHYVERFLGSYPLAIEIVAKDTEEFQSVLIQLRNKLSTLIKSYELVVILKQHKQESFPSGMVGAFGENDKC